MEHNKVMYIHYWLFLTGKHHKCNKMAEEKQFPQNYFELFWEVSKF